MIGMIITGHGNFATGIESALTLIGGKPSNFYAIDFVEGDSTEVLSEHLKKALDSLKACKGVIICADLAGGSPFQVSVTMTSKMKNIEVLGGVNLPLCMELNIMRQVETDVTLLAESMVNTGKEQILRFELVEKLEKQDFSEGI